MEQEKQTKLDDPHRPRLKLTPEDAREHAGLIGEAVAAAVERAGI